jgi:predicted glycosyltransferase
MAGYNTSMNTLAAGVPALMLPFDQNREQRLRVERLITGHSIRMLEETDLSPDRLAALMNEQLREDRYHTSIDLEGARQTAQLLETL